MSDLSVPRAAPSHLEVDGVVRPTAAKSADPDIRFSRSRQKQTPERSALLEKLKSDPDVFWHGSPSGELRGGAYGLHLGTYEAAKQALEARIGCPAEGEWDGTREYGQTLLRSGGAFDAGPNAKQGEHYPTGAAKYSDGTPVALSSKPSITPYRLVGEMSNGRQRPMEDFKANGTMSGQIKRGTAKRGYFYTNIAEDYGSVSIVVPSDAHIAPIPEWQQAASNDTPDGNRGTFEPVGAVFNRRQTETPEFRRWFGDSKVVDETGQPLVVYHGTAITEIKTFGGDRGVAAHFAFNPEFANDFADSRYADAQNNGTDEEYGDGAVVYPAYIRAENIFDARDSEHSELAGTADSRIYGYEDLEANVDKIKAAGFDAYYDFEDGINNPITGIAVFDPTQIKSATGNRGAFDPADPDITMSRRRRAARRLGFDLEEAAPEPCGARCAPEHDAEEAQVMQRASVAP